MSAVATRTVERALHLAVMWARLPPPLGGPPPWAFRAQGNRLDMFLTAQADPVREDVDGRRGLINCGTALLNARVVFAREDLIATVTPIPSGPAEPMFARIEVRHPHDPEEPIPDERLAGLAGRLRSLTLCPPHARDVDLPREVTAKLAAAAAREDAILVRVARADHLHAVERLHRQLRPSPDPDADAWPAPMLVNPVPTQRRPSTTRSVLLLGTRANRPVDWLRTGQALQHVRLELAGRDLAIEPLTWLPAAPGVWGGLRRALSVHFSPQVLFRVLAVTGQDAPVPQR